MWQLYRYIRPILFLFYPETAHKLVFNVLKLISPTSLVKRRLQKLPQKPCQVFGLTFPNPVGCAAGVDNNGDYIDALLGLGFGFVEIGGVTPLPQPGNPKPRIFRIPAAHALINRMGFDNKGVDYLVKRLKQRKVPGIVGVNIAKNKSTSLDNAVHDYLLCLEKLYPYVDYMTINISSPNTPGLRELQSEKHLETLLNALKTKQQDLDFQQHRHVPLLVKLAPDLNDEELQNIVHCLMRQKVEGVIATNTSIDHSAVADYEYAQEQGGLSGAPIMAPATTFVKKIQQMSQGRLPIIALGGIMSAGDAQQKFAAGASLVQIYTGLIYQGPALIKQIVASL